MRWLVFLFAVMALAMGDDACAQQRGSTSATPEFSAVDRAIIARNKSLERLVDRDPALVRRVLDALKEAGDLQTRGALERPSDDPDLDRAEASPEASNDLFQLLKQVRPRPSR